MGATVQVILINSMWFNTTSGCNLIYFYEDSYVIPLCGSL